MMLQVARLLTDFGLLVLIWLVQLVIYPGFRYYQRADLLRWHQRYTQRVTYVVLPLMLGQLILTSIQVWQRLNWYTGSSLLIVLTLWASTFLQFVPLHGRIAAENFDDQTTRQLVQKNWLRTVLWTGLFILSFFNLMGEASPF